MIEKERMKEIFNLTYLNLFPYGKDLYGKGRGIKIKDYWKIQHEYGIVNVLCYNQRPRSRL